MRGIVRIAVLLCSTVSLQRWLMATGLALIALGQIGGLAGLHAPILGAAGLGLVLLFVAVLPLGLTLRATSAPRTLALIPHVRIRTLLAALLVVLTFAALVAGNVALFHMEVPSRVGARVGPDTLFVWALGVETLAMLYFFLLSASQGTKFLLVFLLVIVLGSRWSPLEGRLAASGMPGPGFLLLLTAGIWLVFALWYLGARRISPATWDVRPMRNRHWTWGHRSAPGMSGSKGESRVSVSRSSAMRAQLLGLPSVLPIAKYSVLPVFFVAILLGVAQRSRPAGHLPANLAGAYMFLLFCSLMMAVGFSTAATAWVIARRSRLLWLQSGCTRNELFRTCERLAWYCFGIIGASTWALCAAVWIWFPHPAGDWRYLLVAALAPCACALYVGLMNVRGWQFIDAVAAVLTVATAFISFIAAPRFPYAAPAPWIIVIAEVLGAIGLRALAQWRWRRIDWLICKPQQLPSGFLRPVV
jgi:hypothetical protein